MSFCLLVYSDERILIFEGERDFQTICKRDIEFVK